MTKLRQFLSLSAVAVFVAGAAGCSAITDGWGTQAAVDDAALSARVKAALVKDEGVDATAITVNTHRREVVLTGFVDSERMSDRADLVAWKVDGVLMVRNDLHVGRAR